MNLKKLVACIFISVAANFAYADSESLKQAEILMNSIDMNAVLQKTIDQAIDIQLQQNPTMSPYRTVLTRFFNKYMSYASMKPFLLKMYADTFTADELNELNKFYASPAGRKSLQVMPTLMAKGSQYGAQQVRAHMPELQSMFAEESKRIQQLQKSNQETTGNSKQR
jgi:uncharacterized protein